MQDKYYVFHSLYSTNETAKRLWSIFDPHKLNIVTTSKQISGKGRNNHTWISSFDSLTASFCFILPNQFFNTEKLFTLGTSSIQRLLFQYIPESSIFFKWPNDILVNKKKISGILCETQKLSQGIGIVLGIGINVNNPPVFFNHIKQPATSLFIETNVTYNLQDILKKLTELIKQEIIKLSS